jgi:DNA-binding CsgD family transcriptional regulator
LYIRFELYYAVVYALVSLVIIALSILLAPVLARIAGGTAAGDARSGEALPEPGGADGSGNMQEEHPLPFESLLTARECEVACHLLRGSTSGQIADMLHISPSTVKVHCRNIYEKLKIHSRIELIYLYGNGSNGGNHNGSGVQTAPENEDEPDTRQLRTKP